MRCAIKNCNNDNDSKANTIRFFAFPSNPALQKQWIRFCCRNENFNPKTSVIYMEHFKPKDIKNKLQYDIETPTDIQRDSIGPALLGHDVVGAAVTGSGKTLAFLIPVLEHLFLKKWSRSDGLGVIIISPTRELAYQTFEMLKKIGKYHDLSAGLIIGGKNLRFERNRMDQCNILICTPGRLLQHMDENPLFDARNMQILVIDEADRCLDLGFEKSLNAIIENLPPTRQTLLFSATQNCSADVFARLNLQNIVFTGTCNSKKILTVPKLLQQSYVIIELEHKITMIWSFIKTHLNQKIIVFLTSCKQVKYIYEIFCKLRPGISLLALYGTLSQDRRIAIYADFLNKRNVVLFATDIASRGLDFPSVNWVVQLDCPEDVTQYVHRAGRSARNKTHGESLLVLMTSEIGMVKQLQDMKIQIKKIEIDSRKLLSPRTKIEALCAQNPELKASAQRAFISYIKSVCLMKNKSVFKVQELDFNAYAKSLGLILTPRVRFLERMNQKSNSKTISGLHKPNESDDDSFFIVKRVHHDVFSDVDDSVQKSSNMLVKNKKILTKAALAKKIIKKNIKVNQKYHFDKEGIKHQNENQRTCINATSGTELNGIDLQISKDILAEEDKLDKDRFKKLIKIRHRKLKEKLKKRKHSDTGNEGNVSEEESFNAAKLEKVHENNSLSFSTNITKSEKLDCFLRMKKRQNSELSLHETESIAAHLLALS